MTIRTRPLGDDFTAPIDARYFEDYTAGTTYEYGHVTVEEAEIIEFARRFDPQPIHVDPDFAASGPFKGIIASGWHTGSIMMRLFADHFLSRVASLASPASTSCAGPPPSVPAIPCACASPFWTPARRVPSRTAASSAPAPNSSTRTTRSSCTRCRRTSCAAARPDQRTA
ncbi:MaoC/PaaZ C-terminal domain-containing protein [Actinomadura mexicana]|uniref:MaoC like domain-containing protein n=1 Tax=Actinomadura mexicana TaxID=134959 RepID=A0A239CBV4_9ACTN|nr:MaoC/PaaZ C-terminal domain-containing protein [Actinomadura mexicana]SNS17101.1 MaoC like domain-containing protein [Actinomadura mexicana]